MPSAEEVAKGLTIMAANFNVRVAESTMDLWKLEFHETDAALFRAAVSEILEDEEQRKLPTLGHFKRILRNVEASKINDAFSSYECPKCEGQGMFFQASLQGTEYAGMVVCMCALGQRKREWLESERQSGRAYQARSMAR